MPVTIEEIKQRIAQAAATNRNPLYDSHLYWAQKPYNICDLLIEAFSQPGDLVFDPFLGSGVTVLEAVKNEYRRRAVGCEINEAPLFLIRTLLKQYDLQEYRAAAAQFQAQLRELLPFYHTACPHCGGTGVITTVVFDKPTREAEPAVKEINYRCSCSDRARKEPDGADIQALNRRGEITHIRDEVLIEDTKLAVYENQRISQIFTGRNFTVLDRVLGIIDGMGDYRGLFQYLLMSVLHLCKITDKRSSSQWPLWIPRTDCVEKNVVELLERKIRRFEDTIRYLGENYSRELSCSLLHKGSQHLTEQDIPDGAVQLLITDPPYLGQVAYSEYMQLYKPFLGLQFNLEDEIVVSSAPSRQKNEDGYFKDLETVFSLCGRKVREDGYLCLYFHDCSLTVWDRLIKLMERSHFQYLSQAHIKKSHTLKNNISPKKSLTGDAVLFFQRKEQLPPREAAPETLEQMVAGTVSYIRRLVGESGPLSTPELYDGGLLNHLISRNWLTPLSKKYKTLVELFETCLQWDAETCKWKLP